MCMLCGHADRSVSYVCVFYVGMQMGVCAMYSYVCMLYGHADGSVSYVCVYVYVMWACRWECELCMCMCVRYVGMRSHYANASICEYVLM